MRHCIFKNAMHVNEQANLIGDNLKKTMDGYCSFPKQSPAFIPSSKRLRVIQRIEARSCTLWSSSSSSLCATRALEFALVHRESHLLLRFPLSFELLQRLPSLRILALFLRQWLWLRLRRGRSSSFSSFGRNLVGSCKWASFVPTNFGTS